MRLIDLHCDTLYKSVLTGCGFDDNALEACVSSDFDNLLQCYAVWIPDDYSGEQAEALFYKAHKRLCEECNRLQITLLNKNSDLQNEFINKKQTAYFTIENSSALNGKLENVQKFAELGVRMMTLTWNAHNDVGDGADVENAKGITDFGKSAVKEMEKNHIIVDVSHASDKLFYDVADITEKPFVASHSNLRTVTPHRRNLTDEQFNIIKSRKGIVGLNFHNAFLSDVADDASMTDLLRHTEHFLALGGEDVLCIGGDFDGCTLPLDIKGRQSMYEIYNMFLKHGYTDSLINKIFYENALKFFENFDI